MKIFITGASSFTGCHIARAFCEDKNFHGCEIWGFITKKKSFYSGITAERMKYSLLVNWIEDAPFGSDNFLDAVSAYKPDVFINHGASVAGYRDSCFDVNLCKEISTKNINILFNLLPKNCHFIHSGSFFEKDPERFIDEYQSIGLAKTLIWKEVLKYKDMLKLTKVSIPDPVGAFENPERLGPVFFKKWKCGEKANLYNSDMIIDRIPAEWLAKKYVQQVFLCKNIEKPFFNTLRPSCFSLTQEDWVKILAYYFEKFENKKCPGWNYFTSESCDRVNTDKVEELEEEGQVSKFFEQYIGWLLK